MSPADREREAAVPVLGQEGGALARRLETLSLHLTPEAVQQLAQRLQRDPTLAELTLVNSMWSEHCSYKSTRALLRTLPTQAPNVVLGPGADAGIVRLPQVDASGRLVPASGPGSPDDLCLAVAHESHNHPSQLLPVEGAATGIGGIVRDVYCMGADVVGVLDILRFGDPHGPQGESVRQIVQGVVAGIAAYGNALGVPNLGGGIEFDAAFDDNCLVNVVALGLLREGRIVPSRAPAVAGTEGYVLMLIGKPTDDSGLGGAAFASGLLETDEGRQDRGAVQLPDPFFKRVLTEANHAVLARLHAHGAPFAFKDLGAAGFGGASSELAGELGVDIDLDAVHTDQPDRPAAVVLVAETQERYVLALPAELAEEVRALYEERFELGSMVRGAGARVVGRFNTSGRYRAQRHGRWQVDVPTTLISEAWEVAWPHAARPSVATTVAPAQVRWDDVPRHVQAMLSSLHGGSRYPVFARYDSDVQGRTVCRPGDADAGLLLPERDDARAVAIATAGPARLGKRDAWRAGVTAVCEAVRNVVAVGATPWALTDCLNFGSPETPHGMQDLHDAVRGLGDAARGIGLAGSPGSPLPFVSGNVSLYNESRSGRAIPPTPVVACFGVVGDVARARTSALRHAGDVLFRLGRPQAVLGGSLWARVTGDDALEQHGPLPGLDIEEQRRLCDAVLEAFAHELLSACHDVGDGGEILALAEMCWDRSGRVRFGATWSPTSLPDDALAAASLFDETPGFVCAVAPAQAADFERIMDAHDVPCERRGVVTVAPTLQLQHPSTPDELQLDLTDLARRWRAALEDVLETQEVSA